MRLRKTIFFTPVVVLALAWARAQTCPELQRSPLDESAMLAFLKDQHNAKVKPDCAVYAIFELGDIHSGGKGITGGPGTPAVVDLLVQYLDYQRPPSATGSFESGDVELYPARSALISIGKSATSALLTVIKIETTSDIARANALDAFMTIHRSNHVAAVALLKAEVKRQQDVAAAERLRKALKQAVGMCYQSVRPECEKTAAD